MNILMVGSGKGSFEVRGRQLGAALGARVIGAPSDDDLRWADVVVLIKHAGLAWAPLVRRFKKPIVWDALDFWAQPYANGLNEIEAKSLLRAFITDIKPALVIGATEAMARDAGGVCLPHHSRPGLTPAPAREHVEVVGYEGSKKYLGRWAKAVRFECDRRGWQFVINPPDLRACDILVAFRDGQWDGWMCREWKSGVKITNAIACARPIITQYSAAGNELCPSRSVIESTHELADAFDRWSYIVERDNIVRHYAWMPSYSLQTIADGYRNILEGVVKAKAA